MNSDPMHRREDVSILKSDYSLAEARICIESEKKLEAPSESTFEQDIKCYKCTICAVSTSPPHIGCNGLPSTSLYWLPRFYRVTADEDERGTGGDSYFRTQIKCTHAFDNTIAVFVDQL
jgi:hypothetical protein